MGGIVSHPILQMRRSSLQTCRRTQTCPLWACGHHQQEAAWPGFESLFQNYPSLTHEPGQVSEPRHSHLRDGGGDSAYFSRLLGRAEVGQVSSTRLASSRHSSLNGSPLVTLKNGAPSPFLSWVLALGWVFLHHPTKSCCTHAPAGGGSSFQARCPSCLGLGQRLCLPASP